MGLFALPTEDTPEEKIRTVIANLTLWQDWNQPYYLLRTFALGYLLEAMGLTREQIHQVYKLIHTFQGEDGEPIGESSGDETGV